MNIIVCTSIDLQIPCAAINRIDHLKRALKPLGVNIYICGSSNLIKNNYSIEKDKIYFRKKNKFKFLPKAIKYNINAGIFYSENLDLIIKQLKIEGIIIYSMFSTLIEPIERVARKEQIFVITDGGEKYSVNLQNLLNGINYMQYRAIFYSLKKVDGLMVCSPRWQNYANSIGKRSILFPSFLPENGNLDSKISRTKNNKFRVVFMGSISPREKPKTIFNAILICQKLGYNFQLTIIGRQSFNLVQKISFKSLSREFKNNKDIKFTGFISDSERNILLNSADCLVLLRPPCKETYHLFPTRLPEYFKTQKPVILTKLEPFSFFYEHKKEVYFIKNNNRAKDLANAFIDLYKNPKLSAEIGFNGYKYAEINYSYENLGVKIKNFIENLYQKNKNRIR